MKRILFLFVACVAVFACTSKEQKMSEELLKGSLKAPSTYKFISFEQESVVTLGDELDGRIDLYQSLVDSDKSFVNLYARFVNDSEEHLKQAERDRRRFGKLWDDIVERNRKSLIEYQGKLDDQRAKLKKDQSILDALIKLHDTENLTQETGKIYVLTYEAQNTFGVPLKGEFRTHFKSNGELVECKSEDEEWVALGNVFSIPGYYELIGETEESE